ncbi:MAG: hypothetical protein L3K10_00790 [Thermoplasmata archaeon]|nr:hypothetical protein [Thermoplasmata archaeon]
MSDRAAEGQTPKDPPSEHRSAPWYRAKTIDLLRIGTGLVWLVNLAFIVDPANQYWSSFSRTALSFAPSTLGGPGLAQYAAAHALLFSWSIALLTGYLAIALLFGVTTRLACFVGSFFSAILLATQFGTTFLFPGGTDVGAHPLYILVYAILVLGGAGESLSLDQWIRAALVARRRARASAARPAPRPWASAMSLRTLFTFFVAGTFVSLAIGFGLVVALPVAPASTGSTTTGPVHYVNLTVSIDPMNGWPQFSPANFSVPAGRVVFTILDRDAPMSWGGCPCPVQGTVGGVELLNGSPIGRVPATNVAHTFNIFILGLQVLSPGQSVVQFTVDFVHPGVYAWSCIAPCGTGSNPYNSPPMNVPGFMTGTLTVT